MARTDPRKGQPDVKLDERKFRERFTANFYDPTYAVVRAEIDAIGKIAWECYVSGRKAPRTQKAGAGYADPNYDLSIEWIAARNRIEQAALQQRDSSGAFAVMRQVQQRLLYFFVQPT